MVVVSTHLTPVKQAQYLTGFQFAATPLDLSNAKKLEEAEFRFNGDDLEKIAKIIGTISNSPNLKIIIHLPLSDYDIKYGGYTLNLDGWKNLDDALVPLLKSHSKCVKFVWHVDANRASKIRSTETEIKTSMERYNLLPKVMEEMERKMVYFMVEKERHLTWFEW